METIGTIGYILGLYWGYMGMMEEKMEITIMGYIGFGFVGILSLLWAFRVGAELASRARVV